MKIRHFAFLLLLLAVAAGGLVAGAAGEKKTEAPLPKIHPMVFSMVQGWLSDGESPIVTEINLDAVAASHNQFDPETAKQEEEWTRCPTSDGKGFLRYKMLETKGQRYKVEYQENGGGSLTTSATIEYTLDKREIRKDGKATLVRVLHVISFHSK
jgi:hypothetical protein